MALASLVSFQEQKHKSDYELAKARVLKKAKTLGNQDRWKSNSEKAKAVIGGGNKQIFFMSLVDTR